MFARLSRFNARAWNYRQLFEVARSRRGVVIASAVVVALGGAVLLWPSAPASAELAKKSITWKAFAPKKKVVAAKPKAEPREEHALNMPAGMTMKPVTPPAAPTAAAPPKASSPPKASIPPKPVAAAAKPAIVKSTSPVPVAQGGVAVKPLIRPVVKPAEAASPVVAAKPVSAAKVKTAKPAAVAARPASKSNRPPTSDVASGPAPTATAAATPAPPAAAAGTALADPLGPLFIDEQNGFAMRFPARWALRSLGSEGWVLDCGDAKTGLISVGFSPFPAGFTAETIPASWVARRIQNRGDTTLHAQGYAMIGGRKALWNKSTGPLPMSNGSPRMTRVNYILPLNDGRVLELRVASTPEAFDKLVPLMRKAVETFRFTAPQAPSATVKKETVAAAE